MTLQTKLQKDDPRLLQYVLKEISLKDSVIVEDAMSRQPEIAAEIQVLKRMFADISDFESSPTDLALSAERRKKLFEDTIYKEREKVAWTSRISQIFKFRYATGGLIAATFAILVFNHSLKNEVQYSKNKADSAIVSQVEDRMARNVAPRAKDLKAEDVSQQKSKEIADRDVEKKRLESRPESAPAEAEQLQSEATAVAESEQVFEKDSAELLGAGAETNALSDAAPTEAAKALDKEISAAPPASPATIQAQTFGASKSAQLSGGSNAKASGERRGNLKDDSEEDLLSAFGSSGARRLEKSKGGRIVDYDIEILADGLASTKNEQLKAGVDQCLKKSSIKRDLRFTFVTSTSTFEARENPLTQSETDLKTCLLVLLREIDKSVKTVQIEVKPLNIPK